MSAYLTETELQQRADRMVHREVNCCLSSLVATLATTAFRIDAAAQDMRDLCEQAFELAAPIDDYEEAATQAGWSWDEGGPHWFKPSETPFHNPGTYARTAEEACESDDLEPIGREVFEHWAVSNWLAERLRAKGEKVDTDFAGLNVWGRTMTGQGISMDGVIRTIVTEMAAS